MDTWCCGFPGRVKKRHCLGAEEPLYCQTAWRSWLYSYWTKQKDNWSRVCDRSTNYGCAKFQQLFSPPPSFMLKSTACHLLPRPVHSLWDLPRKTGWPRCYSSSGLGTNWFTQHGDRSHISGHHPLQLRRQSLTISMGVLPRALAQWVSSYWAENLVFISKYSIWVLNLSFNF